MAILFAVLIGLIHVYVFYLEAVSWGSAATNRLFRVSEADARTLKKMAFNQGFYNLFLSLAIFSGLGLRFFQREAEGNTLIGYAALSVLGAGFALLASDPSLKRPALIQILPVLGYLGFRFLGY